MALVLNIGEWRVEQVPVKGNWFERYLEYSLFRAEMARVEITRADHPQQVKENIVNILTLWAILQVGLSAYLFVKYVI